MATLTYTTLGYIKCKCCELAVGDSVDIPILADNVPDVPETVRVVVQQVTPVMLEDGEGREYLLEYDESVLGPNLTELRLCDVGMPTCVSDATLSKEYADAGDADLKGYVDQTFVDLSTQQDVEVQSSTGTTAGSSKTLNRKYFAGPIEANAPAAIDVVVLDLLTELGLPPTTGVYFRLNARVSAITEEGVNDKDDYGEYSLVGEYDNGVTLHTTYENEPSGGNISVVDTGGNLSVAYNHFDATNDRRLFVDVDFTATNLNP